MLNIQTSVARVADPESSRGTELIHRPIKSQETL